MLINLKFSLAGAVCNDLYNFIMEEVENSFCVRDEWFMEREEVPYLLINEELKEYVSCG